MVTKKSLVRYVGPNDLMLAEELTLAEKLLLNFKKDNGFSINEIIELYNANRLIKDGNRLNNWSDEHYDKLKELSSGLRSTVGNGCRLINNENFISISNEVINQLSNDFFDMITKLKVYERISAETFTKYLNNNKNKLHTILKYKKLVNYYDKEIANILIPWEGTCGILISKYLINNNQELCIPKSFSIEEFNKIFDNYIQSDSPNLNYLQAIMNAPNLKECPISDNLRYKAKVRYTELINRNFNEKKAIKSEYIVQFREQENLFDSNINGGIANLSFDINWLEQYLDYPTILNNLYYVFNMFDYKSRLKLAPVSSDLTSLEKVLKFDAVKNLKLGIAFINKDNLYDCIIINYYKFLQGHKIELGNLLSWFCNVYLPSEFDVSDIRATELDGNKTIGKIRFLLPEIESVVHQYLMYVKYGEVNRDLFEMETGSFKFNDIPSKVNDKYAYASSDDIKNELYCLFSDQSGLSYISRFKEQYDTLFKLILTEKVNISEFLPFQLNRINWLIDRRTIIKDEQGWLSFNKNRVNLLADYYYNDVICIHYLNNQLKSELDKMVLNGDFKIESSLFSKPECNYINYYLNKSTYSNGLDLRNKYVHGKNTSTLEEQNRDYIKILKIMLLVIVKINEEFILSSDIHENYLVLD